MQFPVVWILAWTPYAVVTLIGTSGYANLLTPLTSMLPALFAKSAACIDPFIYSLNHPKIRHEIFRRIYNTSMIIMNDQRRMNSLHSTNARRERKIMIDHSNGETIGQTYKIPKETKFNSSQKVQKHESNFPQHSKICKKHCYLSAYDSDSMISLEERKQPSANSNSSSIYRERADSTVIACAKLNQNHQESKWDKDLLLELKNVITSEV
jgi:hypothetical protein